MPYDEEYFNSEEFRELLDSYEASVASGSQPFMDADDLVDIADYYNMVGDFDKAVDLVNHTIEIYPHATLPNVFKAREALQQDDFQAARHYADCIESKDDPDYHYLTAEIMIAEGHVAEADKYLRDYGLTVGADEYQDFVKDCANLFIDYGINDKAYEWMMRSKNDGSDDFKELMARTLFGLGKYDDSERLFNELLDKNPFSKQYWNALANTQFMKEDYNSAVTSSEYAIAIDPHDPESLLSKANGLFRLNNFEEAANYYLRYLEASPDDDPSFLAQIHLELAFCYSAMKQPREALEMLDRTADADCDHIDMLVIRGHILLENNMVEEAEAAFRQAIILSDSSPAVLLRIIMSLYDNHYLNACYQLFLKFFTIIETYEDDFSDGYAYMALCCHDMGKKDEFLYYLHKSVELNPTEAQLVLGFMFPKGMDVKDYYSYMYHKLNP